MTSFANMSQSLAASLPHSSVSTTAASSSHGSNPQEDTFDMSNFFYNFLGTINKPATSMQSGASTSASSSTPYDIWSLPSCNSVQAPIPHSREYSSANSSGSPGALSLASITCLKCEERSTTRCLECSDLFCDECCHKPTSECQLAEHTLLPLNEISPNDKEAERGMLCVRHGKALTIYCESCVAFICELCTRWIHKEHCFSPMKGAIDQCRVSLISAIDYTKGGTKAIKYAIDRAVAMTKAYEKETAEASMKIRKVMRSFTQVIEDREKYLLDKVEKMRLAKVNELTEHMNILRGILAGLSHTNETLVSCLDSEGIDLFTAKEKAQLQIDYFCFAFQNMYVTEEKILFIPPNYDLLDQLKRQCDVQSAPWSTSLNSILNPPQRQTLPMPSSSCQVVPSNNYRSLPDYSNAHSRSTYYNNYMPPSNNISSNYQVDFNLGRGQAIPGYWTSISLKPTRSPVSGVPIFSFGQEGHDEGQVSRPWGLCIDKSGHIIIADRRNNRIQIFDNRGKFKTMFGCKGTGPGEFDLPAGITTDMYGRIIVIDKDNHRVQIFNSSGIFICKFGSFGKECGQFQYPWDVAVNNFGNIVVTDTRNHRIQLFTSDGTFLTKFVFEGANPIKMLKGPTTPRGVCFTTTGNIIVSDFENHRLLMVDPALTKVLLCVGREGSNIGELNRPSGIVTDDDGRIIVADSKNHRVLVFSSELRVLWVVDLKSPGLDDKDRPSDVALTPEGYLAVLFETLPDTARDISSHGKEYVKVY